MLEDFLALAKSHGTAVSLVLLLLARMSVFGTPRGSPARGRFRFAFYILFVHLTLLLAAPILAPVEPNLGSVVRIGAALTAALSAVGLGSIVLFEGIVQRLKPNLPRIVPDVLTTLAAFVAMMRTSSQLGFELSGVIATSAVVTAVLGLSLQDTLGNVLGGLALQLDRSIKVGDWVKLGDVTGRVTEIHWRYTAIETRNWETAIVPNSIVMRSQVVVLGRRASLPVQLRRWVYFQVDFRTPPNEVIDAVERALCAQPLANVAGEPKPNCIAVEFGESQTKYAVRYWLTDLAADDPTDSAVRNHIFYALARARIPLSIPAQMVFVTEDDQARHAHKREAEMQRRMAALARIDLFATLSEDERKQLADKLERAPFARGETITREGGDAHHLYMILTGEVSVRLGGSDASREVARLKFGDFFGEMALLTGERRRATTVAITDVDCYRLDAEPFRALLAHRSDLAERVAQLLAQRQTGLTAVREALGAEQRAQLQQQNERQLLRKIREFFELD
jgi:small-conductance mechanosensitive channel/CRP-like cAMP-binding protein